MVTTTSEAQPDGLSATEKFSKQFDRDGHRLPGDILPDESALIRSTGMLFLPA